MPRIVLNIVKERIEDTFIDMLASPDTAQSVFDLLEDVEIKQEEAEVLESKLAPTISSNLST